MHRLHKKCFFPVCVHMWLSKTGLSENADPHTSQEKGFSPVCVRMCHFKVDLTENAVFACDLSNGNL